LVTNGVRVTGIVTVEAAVALLSVVVVALNDPLRLKGTRCRNANAGPGMVLAIVTKDHARMVEIHIEKSLRGSAKYLSSDACVDEKLYCSISAHKGVAMKDPKWLFVLV